MRSATAFVAAGHLSVLLLAWPGYRNITDVQTMLDAARALVDGGVVFVDARTGVETVSPYGLGQPLLFVPAVLAAHAVGGPDAGELEHDLASLVNPLVTAALGTLLFRAAVALGLGLLRAAAFSAIGILGTPFLSMSQYGMSEPATALALLGAVLALLAPRSPAAFAVGGGLLGYAVLARASELALLPVFGLAAVHAARERNGLRRGAGDVSAWLAGLAPPLFLFVAYNLARYGELLVTSYPGIPSGFTAPWFEGLPGLLGSRAVGLFWFAPAAALGLLALPLLARREPRVGSLAIAAFTIHLLLHAKWHTWWGGGTWGPRLLMPVVPLALLGLVPLLASRLAGATLVLAVAVPSVGVSLLGAIHDPEHTGRRLGGGPGTDAIANQWSLLAPHDLSMPMLGPTSGTFWPTLTWGGNALATLLGASVVGLLVLARRARPATIVPLFLLPVAFVLLRESAIPYRVLSRGAARSAAASAIPAESLQVVCNGNRRAPSTEIWLQGMAHAELRTFLRRGVYALEADLVAPAAGDTSFTCRILLDGETIAAARLPAGGSIRLSSRAFRIHRRGHHALEVATSPGTARHLRRLAVRLADVRLLAEPR